MIYLKLLPYAPELFLILADSRIAELTHMLINGPRPIYLAQLALHLCKSESHLNELGSLGALQEAALYRSLKQLPRPAHTIVLS
jgi:hypothetical protein